MRIAVHLSRPLEKPPEIVTLPPGKRPEFQEADLGHLDPGIGLDAPKQVRTAPRRQMVAPGGIPKETKDVAHESASV